MHESSTAQWDINEGVDDPSRFFRLLPKLFPTATVLFVEGTSITRDVLACYEQFRDPGPYLPRRQTLWPSAKRLRCTASAALFGALARLSDRHAVPELLDHLSLYDGERPLLEWPDAFMNAMLLGAAVPESTVATLAGEFGCQYGRVAGP
jgi:hypothetical protein